ncbi:gp436 family protein [Zavarzinia aquatilis]|uniref:DUF1320 domain-containing protein n=1 Tax=Zavarzinia aquatilis TaxID=2211142 RepID=A0A317DSI9_9PROT|nr:DUF1320 domain-containing protein [Zavarzinia aquatilis]PWR17638.1 DUF1320 domain-containing protein [Zavarzinia aquatilis]
MTYAVKQDLIDRFGELELIQLTDRASPVPTTVDDTVVGRALADADALCDSYLAKLYSLPVASAPPALVKVAADIARFYLHGDAASDGIRTAFEDARKWLQDVARGLIGLSIEGAPLAQPGGGIVRVDGPERVMSRETLRGL